MVVGAQPGIKAMISQGDQFQILATDCGFVCSRVFWSFFAFYYYYLFISVESLLSHCICNHCALLM